MIEINNLAGLSVDKRFFLSVAKKILKGENKELENLSIAFVSSEEISKINKKYRKKDKPTDVLSFQKVSGIKGDFSEIVICPKVVKEKARISKEGFKKELAKTLIHGVLHVLGHDHEISKKEAKKMELKERYYMKKI